MQENSLTLHCEIFLDRLEDQIISTYFGNVLSSLLREELVQSTGRFFLFRSRIEAVTFLTKLNKIGDKFGITRAAYKRIQEQYVNFDLCEYISRADRPHDSNCSNLCPHMVKYSVERTLAKYPTMDFRFVFCFGLNTKEFTGTHYISLPRVLLIRFFKSELTWKTDLIHRTSMRGLIRNLALYGIDIPHLEPKQVLAKFDLLRKEVYQ